MNYLALSALKHYSSHPGSQQERAAGLYSKLRNAVVDNVFSQFAATGQFWEQYDDRSGAGIRGHPFTGWTATVVNILYELY